MTDFDTALHPRISDGTFAEKEQSAPEASLINASDDRFRATKSSRNGHWAIESEQTNPAPVNGRYLIHIGGDARVNTRIGAALRIYDASARKAALADVAALAKAGSKMTVLIGRGNSAQAIEGTGGMMAFSAAGSPDTPVLFLKGSKSRYYRADDLKVLAVLAGYGKQDDLADEFDAVASQVPVTVDATFDGIPDIGDSYPEGDSAIAAVFLMDGPDFGNGKEPGCLFFATDIQTEDDIINGYFWAPSDAGLLTSESGSFYGRDMPRQGGRIRDYVAGSMTYGDAIKLPADRAAGYAAVLSR
jgi:hypothetical protein